MIRYADVLRRLDAGEEIDPTAAIRPAGKATLQQVTDQRTDARRVTPSTTERSTKPRTD